MDRDKRSLPGRGDRLLLSNEFLLLFFLDLEMRGTYLGELLLFLLDVLEGGESIHLDSPRVLDNGLRLGFRGNFLDRLRLGFRDDFLDRFRFGFRGNFLGRGLRLELLSEGSLGSCSVLWSGL